MLEIAVCDDEKKELKTISDMLREICAELKRDCHISLYRSGGELLKSCQRVDIVILDIVMPDCDGIELGKKLKEKFAEIGLIYMTGYEEYYRQVINKVHAFAFLVKPVDRQELKQQLLEYVEIYKKKIFWGGWNFYSKISAMAGARGWIPCA